MKRDKVLEEFQPKHVQPVVVEDNLLNPITTFRGQQIDLDQITDKSNPLNIDGVFREGAFIQPDSEVEWKDVKK